MSDPTAVSRRLVAVFAADVEGYSRMMGADEVGTLKGLTERRAILDRIIGEHRGRLDPCSYLYCGPSISSMNAPSLEITIGLLRSGLFLNGSGRPLFS
jgi:class 3 adenylate cyclase